MAETLFFWSLRGQSQGGSWGAHGRWFDSRGWHFLTNFSRIFEKWVFCLLSPFHFLIAAQHRFFSRIFNEKAFRSFLSFHFLLPRSAEFFSRIFAKIWKVISFAFIFPFVADAQHRFFFENFRKKWFRLRFYRVRSIFYFSAAPNALRQFSKNRFFGRLSRFIFLLPRSAEFFLIIFDGAVPNFFREFRAKNLFL